MQCLEADIAKKHDSVELDASLPASRLYEKRGYKTVKHEKWDVENGVVLVYEIMEKPLASVATDICYDVRFFVPKILDDGKLELAEKWQWLNGDKSEGESVVVER